MSRNNSPGEPRVERVAVVELARDAAPDHELTVVIPAFNEERRLPAALRGLTRFLDAWGIDYRVVVVDDGSRDATCFITDDYGPRCSTLSRPQQGGKGAAVRSGMLSATGRVVAFTDADLPFELSALRSGYEMIRDRTCDMVCGARDLKASRQVAKRSKLRKLASYVFRRIVRVLVSKRITDAQCPLKIFSRGAARELFSRTTIDRFAFDSEVVYLAERMRLPIALMPVTLLNDFESSLSLTRHALPMLWDVLAMRWRALLGKLDCRPPRWPTAYAPASEAARRAA